MQSLLNAMPAWILMAGFGTVTAMMWTWRKRRRRTYSREFMQKLARAL